MRDSRLLANLDAWYSMSQSCMYMSGIWYIRGLRYNNNTTGNSTQKNEMKSTYEELEVRTDQHEENLRTVSKITTPVVGGIERT